MPIYMKVDGIAAVTMKPYVTAAAAVAAVRQSHPAGVNQILIGLASRPGFAVVRDRHGIIAILIGLLLPAVQRLEAPGSAEVQQLRGALRTGGAIGVVMGDGSVRLVSGVKPAGAQYIKFDYLEGTV